MNITSMARTRSMLSGAKLKEIFWVEVISTTCYLINRPPTSSFVDNTLMEVWMGNNPSLQHVFVFGCEEYAHVLKEMWLKLDNKAMKCIFINYGVGVKWYKLWDLVARIFLYSRNVIFKEYYKPSPRIVQP